MCFIYRHGIKLLRAGYEHGSTIPTTRPATHESRTTAVTAICRQVNTPKECLHFMFFFIRERLHLSSRSRPSVPCSIFSLEFTLGVSVTNRVRFFGLQWSWIAGNYSVDDLVGSRLTQRNRVSPTVDLIIFCLITGFLSFSLQIDYSRLFLPKEGTCV